MGEKNEMLTEFSLTCSYSSYGTVLYINTVEHTADGRSLITTTGEKRFEVLHRSTCDGYNTARVRFIEDKPVTNPREIGETLFNYWATPQSLHKI